MGFKRFLRLYNIHSRTRKPFYFYCKNDNEFHRIVRYVLKHPFYRVALGHPDSLSFTTFFDDDDDEVYDSYFYSME